MPSIEQELLNNRRKLQLVDYTGEDRVVPIEELIAELQKDGKVSKKLFTSLPTLDVMVDGFRRGNLIIVSAPTGQGKTTFCKTLTKNFTEQGTRCLWFSYEVPPQEFFESFPKGNQYFTVPRELKSGTLKWIEERIIESKAKYNTNVVFIDHLHFLVEMKDLAIAKNQSILIGMLLRELKKLALANDMIIFLVAHMKKKDTEEELPAIDDLRDSSFVAQESDMVLLLWRKPFPQSKEDKKNKVPIEWSNESSVSIVKNRRTGKLGYVNLVYNSELNEFRELDFKNTNFEV